MMPLGRPSRRYGLDPYFGNVTLLAHLDGTNGGTTFVDSSPLAQSLTPTSFQTSTNSPKFGTACGNPTTTSGRLTLGSSSALQLPGDFTIEMWARMTSLNTTDILNSGIGSFSTTFAFTFSSANIDIVNNVSHFINTAHGMTNGVFSFLAWSRTGSANRIYRDGTLLGSFVDSTAWDTPSGSTIGLGGLNGHGSVDTGLFLDDIRVTKGVGRYPSTCAVPTAAFPNF